MPTLEELRKTRIEKLEHLRKEGIDPYPAETKRTHAIGLVLESFADFAKGEEELVLAGRIRAIRSHGGATFFDIDDGSGRIQCHITDETITENHHALFSDTMDVGDIIECAGMLFTTKRGEKSISVTAWKPLAKSLRPLPEEWYGLKDNEERFRKRYLDLLMNSELKDMFHRKANFWHTMRHFLLEKGFLEVETPVLELTPGGADAKAFTTHHDALDVDMYLRISMGELWQKRLMVAGFDKTFEIGRQFRNEGMSREHLQDYTQMEFYWAYANYRDAMVFVEELYRYVVKETWNNLTFDIGDFKSIDLSKKWKVIDYADAIKEQIGIDVLTASEDEFRKKLEELRVTHKAISGRGRLIDALWKQCRKNIKGPVFIVHHPVSVSPLAKRHLDNPEVTERFQVLIAGSEMGNGYTELNDPIDQDERFEEQAQLREEGDVEAQMHDKDFVEALEHGMPPTAGFGVSERLFSFIENLPVRETVLFPLMKPKE